MEFIRKENLTISGPAQEITLVDAGITQDASDFITEIRVPVEPGMVGQRCATSYC